MDKDFKTCPSSLVGVAKKEYFRITKILDDMGLLTTADKVIIEIYCNTYRKYIKAEKELHKTKSFVNPSRTNTSPEVWFSTTVFKQLLDCIRLLGLNPSSRAHLKTDPLVDKNKKEDSFADFVSKKVKGV